MKHIPNKWRQQGAILAFTALLLPMIIVGTGLAVDLGNIYVQYSRLQNATDAAALAGAHAFVKYKEKPVVGGHKNANEMAKQYIKGEFKNLGENEVINDYDDKSFTASQQENAIYYKVKISKEVPLYFLGTFYKKIAKKDTFTLPVESVAAISDNAGGNYFNNKMFIFSEGFESVNSTDNEGSFNSNVFENQSTRVISDTFDGQIVYTEQKAKDNITYSRHSPIDVFYTDEARKANQNTPLSKMNVKSSRTEVKFSADGEVQSGYWSKPTYMEYDYKAFIDYMDYLTNKNNPTVITGDNADLGSSTLKGKKYIRVTNCNCFNMNISETLGEEKDGPIYIYIDNNVGTSNININKNTSRPIILCINGDKDRRSDIRIALGGNTFKGVFYVPWVKDGGMYLNAGNSTFMGTIVTSTLTLANHNASFIYKNYMDDSKNSGSGSGSMLESHPSLVSPPQGLTWN